jgi:hypothetical protein
VGSVGRAECAALRIIRSVPRRSPAWSSGVTAPASTHCSSCDGLDEPLKALSPCASVHARRAVACRRTGSAAAMGSCGVVCRAERTPRPTEADLARSGGTASMQRTPVDRIRTARYAIGMTARDENRPVARAAGERIRVCRGMVITASAHTPRPRSRSSA